MLSQQQKKNLFQMKYSFVSNLFAFYSIRINQLLYKQRQLRERYAAVTGEERLLLYFKSCETAQQIVLSSLLIFFYQYIRNKCNAKSGKINYDLTKRHTKICRKFIKALYKGQALVFLSILLSGLPYCYYFFHQNPKN